MSAVTLRDVALRAGVSEMTVSRVLRNTGYAAPATRERVLRAVSAIGYVPNRIAGSLARKRTNLVGVLVPSMTNQVFPEVLSGVASGLEGASLQVVSPRFEIGREAARYIVERLGEPRPARPVRRVLPFEFVAGQTS